MLFNKHMTRVGVVTLRVGPESYSTLHEKVFRPSVERYCARNGYELVIVDRVPEWAPPAAKHPDCISMVKFLLPKLVADRFDLIMILDADVVITDVAPPFHEMELEGKVGAVSDLQPNGDPTTLTKDRFGNVSDVFKPDPELKEMVNTGMLIMDPSAHQDYFAELVDTYAETQIGHPGKLGYEQLVFSTRMFHDGKVKVLPMTWNVVLIHHFMPNAPYHLYLKYSYRYGMLHHAGRILNHHALRLEQARAASDRVTEIAKQSREPLEGNCVTLHMTTTRDPRLLAKQANFALVAARVSSILEIGFNAGHSANVFLSSNPSLRYVGVDIGTHRYSRPCAAHLASTYPGRFNVHWSDSRAFLPRVRDGFFDAVHVDGGHSKEQAEFDMAHAVRICKTGGLVILDDTHMDHIAAIGASYEQLGVVRRVPWAHSTEVYTHAIYKKN